MQSAPVLVSFLIVALGHLRDVDRPLARTL